MPITLFAADTANQGTANIYDVCSKSPVDCLPLVNSALRNTPTQSHLWYGLMKNKITSLYFLQKLDELNDLTSYLMTLKDLPIPFQVMVDAYHAKTLTENTSLDKDFILQEQQKLIQRAKNSLALMNDIYPDPNLIIQIANVQMYVGENTEAYSLLQSLIVKYSNYPDPLFQLELYGTLGHLADRLHYKKSAIKYWKLALPWAHKVVNNQQIATILFNLAKSEEANKNLTQAQENYRYTIKYATLANDQIRLTQAKIELAELLFNLKEKAEAKALIKDMQADLLPTYIAKKLIALQAAM